MSKFDKLTEAYLKVVNEAVPGIKQPNTHSGTQDSINDDKLDKIGEVAAKYKKHPTDFCHDLMLADIMSYEDFKQCMAYFGTDDYQ